MWDFITGLIPMILQLTPVDVASGATSVIGGAAIVASAFAKPNSQYGRKIHSVVNLLGFNFGSAKNK